MADIQWDNEPSSTAAPKADQRISWDTPADTTPTRPSTIRMLWSALKYGHDQTMQKIGEDLQSASAAVKAAPSAAWNYVKNPGELADAIHPSHTTSLTLAAGGAPTVATRLGLFAAGKMLDQPSASPMENLKTAATGVVGDPTRPMSMLTSPAAMEAAIPFAGKVLRSTPGAKGRIAAADAEAVGNVGAKASPGLTPGTTVQELRQAAVEAPKRLGAAKEAMVQEVEGALNAVPGQAPNFTNAQGQQFVRVQPGHPMAVNLNLGPGPPIPGGRGGTWAPARQQGEIPIPSLGKNMTLRAANEELSSVGDQMHGIKPLDPRYKDADIRQVYGQLARDIKNGIARVAGTTPVGPQGIPAAKRWEQGQTEYENGRAFAKIFQNGQAYRPGTDAGGMELNTPYLQQMLIDPRKEAWLRKKLGDANFEALARELTRGGGIGGKDVLAGGERPLDAVRQLARSGGGTGTVMAAVPRTLLPNVGSTYAGRAPYSVPPQVQTIADLEAQRAGGSPMQGAGR